MGKHGYPDSHYAEVARVYMAALDAPRHGTNIVVARHFAVAKTTADRWVREAQRRGLLLRRPAVLEGHLACSGRCAVHCRRRAAT